jgi:ribonuclease HI
MVFSDGGSFNNGTKNKDLPVFGSTGTIILKDNKNIFESSKAYPNVTNNFCELTAGLDGLNYLNDEYPNEKKFVILISDSQYYIKSLNEWMTGYIKRGWRNNEGKEVKNKEILQTLNQYLYDPNFEILTCWIRGHQSNYNDSFLIKYNNECDRLCNEAINNILSENGYENLLRK